MKNLTTLVALLVILGCSNRTSEETPEERLVQETNPELVAEEQQIPTAIDVVQEIEEDLVEPATSSMEDSIGSPFAFKSFFLTTDYDLSNCEALARCDCCISEVYFMNDSVFVYSDQCEGTTSYTKGTYRFDSKSLTLKHDSLLVIDHQPFGDEDVEESEYGLISERRHIAPTEYLIEACGDEILLHWRGTKSHEYGIEEFQRNALIYIINGVNSEVKQLLELN